MSIDINYYSFSPKRADKKWSFFIEDISILRKKNAEEKKVTLNNRQTELDDSVDLSYLKYENNFDHNQLISDLKYLDIYYGSVVNDYFESPKVEFEFLDIIKDIFKINNDLPTREEWINVFQNIDKEKIHEASNQLVKSMKWDYDYSDWAIIDYLKSIRPVVKDMKNNSDTIFISDYGGIEEVEPEKAETFLLNRAKDHAKKYKGLLPPVL